MDVDIDELYAAGEQQQQEDEEQGLVQEPAEAEDPAGPLTHEQLLEQLR